MADEKKPEKKQDLADRLDAWVFGQAAVEKAKRMSALDRWLHGIKGK